MHRTTRRAIRRTGVAALAATLLLAAACSGDDATDGTDAGTSATTGAAGATSDPGGGTDDAAAGELSLLSYNVAGLPQEISDVDPATNIPLISARLEPYDIVVTQEDFDWWQTTLEGLDFVNYHDRLRSEVTHEHRSERHPGPEAVGLDWEADRDTLLVGDGLGFLSRYPLSDVVRVPWTGCFGGADTDDGGAGDCLAMKGFAVATVELAPGVEVDVYTLHVEAGGSDADQALQADDMAQLATFIEEHSPGRAIILAGDTNLHTDGAHPDSDGPADEEIWSGFLEATGLRDVCDEVTCDEPEGIDKAAVRDGGGVALEVLSRTYVVEGFQDEAGQDLSDHPPLDVRLAWTADG